MTRTTTLTSVNSIALLVVKSATQSRQTKTAAVRVGGVAQRVLNALLRSLAAPHI